MAEPQDLEKLLILRGEVPVAGLRADLAALLDLPENARRAFGEILEPCLAPKLSEETDRQIESFCRKHDALGSRVAIAIRGARFLVLEAALSNAQKTELAADLQTLVGSRAPDLAEILLPLLEKHRERVRTEAVQRTMMDHGALLVGVDYRLDRVVFSQHGRDLDTAVAMLTLTYRDGEQQQRVTLQVDPPTLQRLRAACNKLLGEG